MLNYYEILEVSEKASKEVIEKAYKALAKKYHPDLNHANPSEAESKMKELNEAYSILIDDTKRANFDRILSKKRELENRKARFDNLEYSKTQPAQSSQNTSNNFYINTRDMDEKTKKKLQNKLQERYLEAYDAYLRERGYKLKYKWTFKRIAKAVIAFLCIILIFIILFFIPPIHNLCLDLYENNFVIQILVDSISSFFQ